MRQPADDYLETQVLTASPERLHLMVVDAAIRFARQGKTALERADFESSFEALGRSRACVTELIAAVHAEPNPELARRIKSLFLFVHRRLTRADLQHDGALVDDALRILELHRQTWLELLERLQRERSELAGPHRVSAAETSWTT